MKASSLNDKTEPTTHPQHDAVEIEPLDRAAESAQILRPWTRALRESSLNHACLRHRNTRARCL